LRCHHEASGDDRVSLVHVALLDGLFADRRDELDAAAPSVDQIVTDFTGVGGPGAAFDVTMRDWYIEAFAFRAFSAACDIAIPL
jgi:hypothetical protein